MVARTTLAVFVSLHSTAALSQEARSRIALGGGIVVYDGAGSESGVGPVGSVQLTISHLERVELTVGAGVSALTPLAQTCTLGVPSGCSPADPASPTWHLRMGLSPQLHLGLALFFTVGMGVYGPVGPADRSSALAMGVDVGFGVRASRRVAVELRYLHLRAAEAIGTGIPLLVQFRL